MEKKAAFILEKIKIFVLKNLNIFLLASILSMFFISPAIENSTGEAYSLTLFFTIVFLSSVVAIKTRPKRLLIAALIISIYSWIKHLYFDDYEQFNTLFFITFFYFFYILIRLIIQLIKVENVDFETIMEAINIYLLIGLVGAITLSTVNHFVPGSLNGIPSETKAFHDYLYFSFVTLSTLGYGDISPALPLAKSVVVFLAVVGQFYIAIVMAFLISKFISNKSSQNK